MAALLLCTACEPSGGRPGLWLSGEPGEFPEDWAFTNEHREIRLQVATPYLIPHSVIIWCGEVDGELYVAARDPDSKNWPGWVADDPTVKLEIDGRLYAGSLAQVREPVAIEQVAKAYSQKYQLPEVESSENGSSMRYWLVQPQSP